MISFVGNRIVLSIVILNYNKSYYTKACVESILDNARAECYMDKIEMIIVSNGSTSEDLRHLESLEVGNEAVKLIRNETNLGFAEGNNLGFSNSVGKFVIFLNHDTLVTPGWFKGLVEEFSRDSNIGGAQCKIVEIKDRLTIQSSGCKINLCLGLAVPDKGRGQEADKYIAKVQDIAASGCAFVIRRDVAELLGTVFDGDYFANFEDMDLTIRIYQSGYQVVLLPTSVIYHHNHGSNVLSEEELLWRKFHTSKNVICTYLKDFEVFNSFKYTLLFVFSNFFLSIAQSFYRKNYRFIKVYFEALIWNFKNLPGTSRKRDEIQKLRKVSDTYILSRICIGF